jgi:hypothetical protein
MKRISFNPRFINAAGNDLIPCKIHTIRQNYEYWKRFEGQEVELFTWEGKPYRSKQKVFCVKKIVSVQETWLRIDNPIDLRHPNIAGIWFFTRGSDDPIEIDELAKNDGLELKPFKEWFINYPLGKMAVIHFTSYRY